MSEKQKILDTSRLSEQDIKNYVLERFEDVKQGKIKNLVSFQAMNKYMIMAHNQDELKILGNIVASYKKISLLDIMSEYEKHLKMALEKPPTIKSHSNVIMHIFGYFSKNFSQLEKEEFFKLLNEFKEEEITIGKVLSEINPIIYRFNSTYLASQTYFLLYSDPQPGNLFHTLSQK
ncbi:MAG: YbgA family protein [Nitrosopumilaceae archaeon]|nr:YbgA family protein [Nitrosopumilaceae archaeon]